MNVATILKQMPAVNMSAVDGKADIPDSRPRSVLRMSCLDP